MIQDIKTQTQTPAEITQLNTLTLERNSVLIARVSRDEFYDAEMLQSLYKGLKNRFPCHEVFVWYDDVEFMVIHDKAYNAERITCNEESSYYN